jgi:hypothetical protein
MGVGRAVLMLVPLGAALALSGCASARGASSARSTKRASEAPLSRAEAIATLEATDTFAGTSVGFGGGPSKEACAFATLIRQPDAALLFKDLLARGQTAGQLYALSGLYFADPAAFREAIEPYRGRTDPVKTLSGCIGGAKPVGEIVEHPGPHAVRLASSSENVQAWLDRNPDARRSFFMDISGGGYPSQFRALRPCRGH